MKRVLLLVSFGLLFALAVLSYLNLYSTDLKRELNQSNHDTSLASWHERTKDNIVFSPTVYVNEEYGVEIHRSCKTHGCEPEKIGDGPYIAVHMSDTVGDVQITYILLNSFYNYDKDVTVAATRVLTNPTERTIDSDELSICNEYTKCRVLNHGGTAVLQLDGSYDDARIIYYIEHTPNKWFQVIENYPNVQSMYIDSAQTILPEPLFFEFVSFI